MSIHHNNETNNNDHHSPSTAREFKELYEACFIQLRFFQDENLRLSTTLSATVDETYRLRDELLVTKEAFQRGQAQHQTLNASPPTSHYNASPTTYKEHLRQQLQQALTRFHQMPDSENSAESSKAVPEINPPRDPKKRSLPELQSSYPPHTAPDPRVRYSDTNSSKKSKGTESNTTAGQEFEDILTSLRSCNHRLQHALTREKRKHKNNSSCDDIDDPDNAQLIAGLCSTISKNNAETLRLQSENASLRGTIVLDNYRHPVNDSSSSENSCSEY